MFTIIYVSHKLQENTFRFNYNVRMQKRYKTNTVSVVATLSAAPDTELMPHCVGLAAGAAVFHMELTSLKTG